jgi:hypothetical protein
MPLKLARFGYTGVDSGKHVACLRVRLLFAVAVRHL